MIGIRIMSEVERPVAEVAAAWVLEEEQGLSLARNGLLEAWLAESEDHVVAYHHARFAYEAVGRQGPELEMMALREAALRARPERFGLPSALIAASVVAVAVVGMGGWWVIDRAPAAPGSAPTSMVAADPRAASYQTAVGERSTVSLPDGSLMTLNTASLAQVVYDRSERGVRLLAGQAMFTVAQDRAAPFRVYAGDRVITATGTAFEVYAILRCHPDPPPS
jgi:transmembrane sensor